MTTLLAQVSSGEWYEGWQLVLSAIGAAVLVVIAVVGWLYKQTKADISDLKGDMNRRFDDMNRRFDRTDDRVDDLYKMLAQRGTENPAQQPQTAEPRQHTEAASAPVNPSAETETALSAGRPQTSVSPAVATASQSQTAGFTPASAQGEK